MGREIKLVDSGDEGTIYFIVNSNGIEISVVAVAASSEPERRHICLQPLLISWEQLEQLRLIIRAT